MRITCPQGMLLHTWPVDQALAALRDAPSPHTAPPCANCRNHRPALCSPRCPDAAGACSSDPQAYPVEAAVLPMVYELNALRVFQSCWSCEGHLDTQGRLWKRPQVSFYAASPACVMLLANHLQSLYRLRRLSHGWQIAFTDYGVSLLPTYCIEPRVPDGESIHLGNLQRDLRTMSEGLGQALRMRANQYLQQQHVSDPAR